jgi:dipeptidyl aminopeptidase/acylaminoacyl peptidase
MGTFLQYIRNSPIFRANNVNTPLLIIHNEKDIRLPRSQGVEFFTGLRRLNKKVWMLQYDNGNHVIRHYQEFFDYTTLLLQFFDHYLKEVACPVWMEKETAKGTK